ncbi:6-aminohexanoate hydrolase, partial [Bradyrhizobium guangdongense]
MSDTSEPDAANLSNWRNSPHNRWAFRNVPCLLPVADIAASSQPMPLPSKPSAFDRFGLANGKGGTLGFDDVLDATDTDGLVVLHQGRIVYESYRNGLTARAPHIVMSASKSLVGLIAGIIADEGASISIA